MVTHFCLNVCVQRLCSPLWEQDIYYIYEEFGPKHYKSIFINLSKNVFSLSRIWQDENFHIASLGYNNIALCGGIAPYVATFLVSIFHLPAVSFVFGQLEKSSPYTPDHPGVCDDVNLKTLVQTRMGAWMEMIPDRRCSIWFPNKVHRSSPNKYAE